MPLILPNDIANEQLADGAKLQQNYASIEDWLNTETILRDGSVAMTNQLLLPGTVCTQPNQAASKKYVDDSTPGGIVAYQWGLDTDSGGVGGTGWVFAQVTYPEVAGRTYRVSATVCCGGPTNDGTAVLAIQSATNVVHIQASNTVRLNSYVTASVFEIYTATANNSSAHREALLAFNPGDIAYVGSYTRPGIIVVEDIGILP